jgi:neopullulanase
MIPYMLRHDDVIYMIVTDRFADGDQTNNHSVDRTHPLKRHGGDLLGIIAKMPYLRNVGVTTLWISPVYLNPPDSYHGYHPLDFDSVDPHVCSPSLGPVGSRETIRRFVEIAHENGFKVMLDMIVSHTGEAHPWREQKPDWINWDGTGVEKEWFKGLPNLDHDNINVNVYFIRNLLQWISETDADAVRIDAARHVESRFWRYFKLYAMGEFPGITVVGEFWDGVPDQVAVYQNLHGFDAMFDFPLYHALRDVFIGDQPFFRLARPHLHNDEPCGILDLDPVYRNAMRLITFVGNHDTSRFFTEAGGETDSDRALQRLKLAQAFIFCERGIPQIYYGDELAMPGGWDPDNRRDMPWNWIDLNDSVDAGNPRDLDAARAREMLQHTRRLIEVRRSCPALSIGLRSTLYVDRNVLILLRSLVDHVAVVAFNNSDAVTRLRVPLRGNSQLPDLIRDGLCDGLDFNALLGADQPVRIEEGSLNLDLPARSAVIYGAELSTAVSGPNLIQSLKQRHKNTGA